MRDSFFIIHGVGYCGNADTLDEARAIAKRMGGGIVYVKVNLVEHVLDNMEREAQAAEPPDDAAHLY